MSSSARKLGRDIAWGFCDVIVTIMLLAFLISLLLMAVRPTDDCDRSKFDRCGMKVLTDNKTGIEYLVTPDGGIIRRGE